MLCIGNRILVQLHRALCHCTLLSARLIAIAITITIRSTRRSRYVMPYLRRKAAILALSLRLNHDRNSAGNGTETCDSLIGDSDMHKASKLSEEHRGSTTVGIAPQSPSASPRRILDAR
jgi:hypothetical protein